MLHWIKHRLAIHLYSIDLMKIQLVRKWLTQDTKVHLCASKSPRSFICFCIKKKIVFQYFFGSVSQIVVLIPCTYTTPHSSHSLLTLFSLFFTITQQGLTNSLTNWEAKIQRGWVTCSKTWTRRQKGWTHIQHSWLLSNSLHVWSCSDYLRFSFDAFSVEIKLFFRTFIIIGSLVNAYLLSWLHYIDSRQRAFWSPWHICSLCTLWYM